MRSHPASVVDQVPIGTAAPPAPILGKAPTGVLASYWYYRAYNFDTLGECPLILDSGAFSAHTQGVEISLGEYAEWCLSLPGRWMFAFNLDVLTDPVASLANWRALRALGVDTVPVLHFGELPEDHLPAYLAEGCGRLALGGLVIKRSGASQVQAWTAYCFRWLRDNAPQVLVHGLGIHTSSRMAVFPWDSTDSSSLVMRYSYNQLKMWLPSRLPNHQGRGRWRIYPMDGHSAFRAPFGPALRNIYHVDPAHVAAYRKGEGSYYVFASLISRIDHRAAMDFNLRRPSQPASRFLVQTDVQAFRRFALEIEHLRQYEGSDPWPWPYPLPTDGG